jgi:hypothetical protein
MTHSRIFWYPFCVLTGNKTEQHMPKTLVIERENLPPVVQGWLNAVGLEDAESVELVFTEREVLLRRPTDPKLREWAQQTVDEYDKAFKRIVGL